MQRGASFKLSPNLVTYRLVVGNLDGIVGSVAHRPTFVRCPNPGRGVGPPMEVDTVTDSQASQWYEHLSETERHECAEVLTDAYFSALSADNWRDFEALVRQWVERADEKQPVAV